MGDVTVNFELLHRFRHVFQRDVTVNFELLHGFPSRSRHVFQRNVTVVKVNALPYTYEKFRASRTRLACIS